MPHVLAALMAFVAEHQRCGDLDSGTDNGYVWMECSCGGLVMQPTGERPMPGRPDSSGTRRPVQTLVVLV